MLMRDWPSLEIQTGFNSCILTGGGEAAAGSAEEDESSGLGSKLGPTAAKPEDIMTGD